MLDGSIDNVPIEILRAACQVGGLLRNSYDSETRNHAHLTWRLVEVSELLAPPTTGQFNTMADFVAASTGVVGLDHDNLVIDESKIIHEIRQELLANIAAQALVNEYFEKAYGRRMEFPQETAASVANNHFVRNSK